MSLSPYLPTGSSVGYGFQMQYRPTYSSSVDGAFVMYDDNIQSTGTASLQIFVPTSSYLDRGLTSASIAQLVTQYTNFPTGTGGEVISTQVVVAPGEITPLACSATCYQGEFPWAFYVGGPLQSFSSYTNLSNRQTLRALKGGVSITSTSHSTPFTNDSTVGTMGLICQDSASGALVGLTNNHVVVRDAFYTSQRTYTNPQNEYDLVDSSNTIQGDFVYQTGETQPVNPGGANEIGRVLRYVPMYTSASVVANPSLTNKVDAAIFSLYCTSSTGQTIIDFAAFGGDTLCPLRIFGYMSFPISYPLQGTNTPTYFTDVIAYVKPFNSASYSPSTATANTQVCPYPVWGGDSGSTLIANIGGVWKIIGLVFAGNGIPYNSSLGYQVASTIGFACRIDQVASQLGIKAWTGSAAPVVDHSTITYRTVSGSNSDKTLVCSGSTYWQVGLTEKHNIC